MKKVLHRNFYYQIPEKSGFPLNATQGKQRIILLDQKEFDHKELHAFLFKILSALKLESSDDLEIISCNGDIKYPFQTLIENGTKDLISFGIPPSQLLLQGFEIIHQVYHFKGARIFFANSLNTYTNEAAKKLLWGPLRKMFGV